MASDRPISHDGAAARGTVVEEDSEKEKEKKTDVRTKNVGGVAESLRLTP